MDNPIVFTASARGKFWFTPIFSFLRRKFGDIPLTQIESVFGFVEATTLYGGRVFMGRELSKRDVMDLREAGVGLRIPLSNHRVERDEYEANRSFLERYHRKGNSLIITNDDLAQWIRQDYPEYQIEASVIKHITTHERIREALEIYDTVVLPMYLCEDPEFLRAIGPKDRITLFANGGCALNCPARICYTYVSKMNKFMDPDKLYRRLMGRIGFICSRHCSRFRLSREKRGVVYFDVEELAALGFRRFKILRRKPSGRTGY